MSFLYYLFYAKSVCRKEQVKQIIQPKIDLEFFSEYMCLVNEEKIQVFSIDGKIIETENLNRPSPADFIKRTWSHEFSNEQADNEDEIDDDSEESGEMRLVTAMTSSCDNLYFATENFALRRLNFMDSSLDTLAIKSK